MELLSKTALRALVATLLGKARRAERDSVAVLARYLRRDLASDDWAARRLLETTLVRRDLARIVRALRSGREGEVFAVLLAAREAGTKTAASLLDSGLTAANFRMIDRDAVAALARALTDTLASTDLRILRAAEDAYRSVIAQATTSGLEGEFTRRAAAQSALNAFADRGITGFIDSAGRAWSLPSYTEMACRTSAMNAGRQGVLDATRAAGRDLVIVGGSAGGCPLCEPWEGEVLSLDGTTPGYSTLDEAEGAGLFHANCTHVPYPYVEGLTDVTKGVQHSDPERYIAEQRQRTMERHVRQWKTRQAAALDDATAWAAALAAVMDALPGIEWHVYCVPGNHGKPGGRKGGAVPATFSFDYLFYRLLEKDLAAYPIAEFAVEAAGRLLFWSAGHVFLCIHGNEVRAWGGFPAYGLDKADARLSKELERAFAYLLLGHWHQAAMMPSGRGARIINGSAVGANQLTQAAVLGATLPTQNMLWVSREYGLAELGLIHLAPGEYTPPPVYGAPR